MHPLWNCGGEHQTLQITWTCSLNRSHDLLDILFETKVQHDISFIEDGIFKLTEVKIFPIHMVLNTTSGANKNIDTSAQLRCLTVDVNTSVYRKHVILIGTVF